MRPDSLLNKFLRRKASQNEVKAFLNHLNHNKTDDYNHELRNEWDKLPIDAYKPEEEYDKLYNSISETIAHKKNIKPINKTRILKYAAAIAVLIASTFLVFKFSNTTYTLDITDGDPIKTIEKVNPTGQKSRIYLPDGSTALLNAESKLIFPEQFGNTRAVELIGEAYFEIAPNKDKPFYVTSENVKTIALGTEFNVRAFPEDKKIHVALTKGKIKVEIDDPKNSRDFLVSPGNSIEYNKEDSNIKESSFSELAVLGWKNGIIYFQDASKQEVFNELERWYGVDFMFENKPYDTEWKYTGQFNNEYLENILKSIGSIKHFDFEIDNKQIKIMFNKKY